MSLEIPLLLVQRQPGCHRAICGARSVEYMHVATKAKVLYHWLEYGRSEAFQAELVGKR